MNQPFSIWLPAVITCGALMLACLVIARMARTVERRLIDVDLDDRERWERRGHRTRTAQQLTDRAERLQSIANHHRAADYLILAALGLVVLNAGLYVGWTMPLIVSVPVLVLLLGLAGVTVWVVRRTPAYDPGEEQSGSTPKSSDAGARR